MSFVLLYCQDKYLNLETETSSQPRRQWITSLSKREHVAPVAPCCWPLSFGSWACHWQAGFAGVKTVAPLSCCGSPNADGCLSLPVLFKTYQRPPHPQLIQPIRDALLKGCTKRNVIRPHTYCILILATSGHETHLQLKRMKQLNVLDRSRVRHARLKNNNPIVTD